MSHRLVVHTISQQFFWPGGATTCAIGKNGSIAPQVKTEGDGMTPLGIYPLRQIYYRADRLGLFATGLAMTALEENMGWCDSITDTNYNKFVRHPYAASAEHLWREDGLYDIVVVLGHNDAPVVADKGSAIFLHCCKYDDAGMMKPTLGCIAIPRDTLVAVLKDATAETTLEIY